MFMLKLYPLVYNYRLLPYSLRKVTTCPITFTNNETGNKYLIQPFAKIIPKEVIGIELPPIKLMSLSKCLSTPPMQKRSTRSERYANRILFESSKRSFSMTNSSQFIIPPMLETFHTGWDSPHSMNHYGGNGMMFGSMFPQMPGPPMGGGMMFGGCYPPPMYPSPSPPPPDNSQEAPKMIPIQFIAVPTPMGMCGTIFVPSDVIKPPSDDNNVEERDFDYDFKDSDLKSKRLQKMVRMFSRSLSKDTFEDDEDSNDDWEQPCRRPLKSTRGEIVIVR